MSLHISQKFYLVTIRYDLVGISFIRLDSGINLQRAVGKSNNSDTDSYFCYFPLDENF